MIAAHRAVSCLAEKGPSQEEAYTLMRKYMMEKVAAGTHRSMVKMEVAPGFYAMDSGGFVSVVCRTELWENMQRRSRGFSGVTWHTACRENGCAELCRLFCGADDVTYGGLSKIGFSRTKTLSNGEDGCDFLFL